MFFSNGRDKRQPVAEVKISATIDASPDATADRFQRLANRNVMIRRHAAGELLVLYTTHCGSASGPLSPEAAAADYDPVMAYAATAIRDAGDEADVAIRIAVLATLRHRDSHANSLADWLAQLVVSNIQNDEAEDAVTTALDALALLSVTHGSDAERALTKLVEELKPQDASEAIHAALIAAGAVGCISEVSTTVGRWVTRGAHSDSADVVIASLQALGALRERFAMLPERDPIDAVEQRSAPSFAAAPRKVINALVRALHEREVPSEKFTLDIARRRNIPVEIVISGYHRLLALQALREFAAGGWLWYVRYYPSVAGGVGIDHAALEAQLRVELNPFSKRGDEEAERGDREVNRDKGRREARDAKARSHEADD